jgi:hypothetical protein
LHTLTKLLYSRHIITTDLSAEADVNDKLNKFYGQRNSCLCKFKSFRPDLLTRVFATYCNSFYGCELWPSSSSNVNNNIAAWRKAIRRVWQLPSTTHCNVLPCLMDGLSCADMMRIRFFKFILENMRAPNLIVNHIAQALARSVISLTYWLNAGVHDSPTTRCKSAVSKSLRSQRP